MIFLFLNFETNFKEQHSRKYIGENEFFCDFYVILAIETILTIRILNEKQ
jgi:hypothetical protein